MTDTPTPPETQGQAQNEPKTPLPDSGTTSVEQKKEKKALFGGKNGQARPKEEVVQLKTRIQVLILAGFTHKEIMTQLKLPQTSFYRYYDAIVEETREQCLMKKDRLLHVYLSRVEEAYRQIYQKAIQNQDARTFKDAADVMQQTFDRLQSAGFIPRSKTEVTSDVTLHGDAFRDYVLGKKEAPG